MKPAPGKPDIDQALIAGGLDRERRMRRKFPMPQCGFPGQWGKFAAQFVMEVSF